jgi:hypothetical protein
MEKTNTDKTKPDGRSGINLENPSFSKNSLRDSGEDQQLSDKDSSSGDAMRSPPNEKDAYIDN